MTKIQNRNSASLRDALYEMALAKPVPDAEVLDDFVRRYPEHAADLTEFAIELALDNSAALASEPHARRRCRNPEALDAAADDTIPRRNTFSYLVWLLGRMSPEQIEERRSIWELRLCEQIGEGARLRPRDYPGIVRSARCVRREIAALEMADFDTFAEIHGAGASIRGEALHLLRGDRDGLLCDEHLRPDLERSTASMEPCRRCLAKARRLERERGIDARRLTPEQIAAIGPGDPLPVRNLRTGARHLAVEAGTGVMTGSRPVEVIYTRCRRAIACSNLEPAPGASEMDCRGCFPPLPPEPPRLSYRIGEEFEVAGRRIPAARRRGFGSKTILVAYVGHDAVRGPLIRWNGSLHYLEPEP